MDKIGTLNDSFWQTDLPDSDPSEQLFYQAITELILGVQNSLFATFNIDGLGTANITTSDSAEFEADISDENWNRFYLVVRGQPPRWSNAGLTDSPSQFIYAFTTGGIVLILMNTLSIISQLKPWNPFNVFRAAVNYLLGLGLTLVSLVTINPDLANQFEITPWLLPTLCLTFFVVLALNHLPHPPPWLFEPRRHHPAAPRGPACWRPFTDTLTAPTNTIAILALDAAFRAMTRSTPGDTPGIRTCPGLSRLSTESDHRRSRCTRGHRTRLARAYRGWMRDGASCSFFSF